MRFPDPASPTSPGPVASVPQRVAMRNRGAIPRSRIGLVLLVVTAGLPGACSKPDAFAPACPQLAMLRDGADLTRFNGHGRDITDLVVEAHLLAVPATCHWADDSHKQVEAKIKVAMSVSRGPSMPGRAVDVPYFVAVSEGDTIYDKQVYTGRINFPANTDRLSLTTSEISLLFPVSHDKSAAAYKITVSYQLTPDELAYNRRQASR